MGQEESQEGRNALNKFQLLFIQNISPFLIGLKPLANSS